MQKKKDLSRIYMIISMAIFGTIGIFKKQIPLSSGEIALYRAVLAVVFLAAVMLISRQKMPLKKIKKEIPLLLLSGAAMGFNWVLPAVAGGILGALVGKFCPSSQT